MLPYRLDVITLQESNIMANLEGRGVSVSNALLDLQRVAAEKGKELEPEVEYEQVDHYEYVAKGTVKSGSVEPKGYEKEVLPD